MKKLKSNLKPVDIIIGAFAVVVLIDVANAGYTFGKWLKYFFE